MIVLQYRTQCGQTRLSILESDNCQQYCRQHQSSPTLTAPQPCPRFSKLTSSNHPRGPLRQPITKSIQHNDSSTLLLSHQTLRSDTISFSFFYLSPTAKSLSRHYHDIMPSNQHNALFLYQHYLSIDTPWDIFLWVYVNMVLITITGGERKRKPGTNILLVSCIKNSSATFYGFQCMHA